MSRITLNVGGRLFETTVQTLTKYADSYFSAFYGGDFRADAEEARFIDRDPRLFEIVLGFLRQGVISQGEFDREIINDEFAFYNLPAPQWPAEPVELVVPICLEWKYNSSFVEHGITPRDSAMPFLRGSLMGEHFIVKIIPALVDAFDYQDSDRKILRKLQKVATKHGFNTEFRLEIHETTTDGNPYGELIFEKL